MTGRSVSEGARVRVLHVSTHDARGGAARAAYRLHSGLRSTGCSSQMYVVRRNASDEDVVPFHPPRDMAGRVRRRLARRSITRAFRPFRDSLPDRYELFSDDRCEFGESILAQMPPADIVNLHWISRFVDYRMLPRLLAGTPVVWTLHDMNPFTGGCHYDRGCGKYRRSCGACPELGSHREDDLSRQVWLRKRGVFERLAVDRLHIVAPSQWMADQVGQSALMGRFPVSVIPYGLDLDAFAPREPRAARETLGLPAEHQILLFVSEHVANSRKGFAILRDALNRMERARDVFLVSVGRGAPDLAVPGARHVHLGEIDHDRLLSMVYSAADAFVIPSVQDNLPNTAIEALACGTPVVGFDVGGLGEIVDSGITGCLAAPGDAAALAAAVDELLGGRDEQRSAARMRCRETATARFALARQAERYATLYDTLLASRP